VHTPQVVERRTDFSVRTGHGIPSGVPRRCTDFPVPTGFGRKPSAFAESHRICLLEGERPLDVLAEPPHGHTLGPGDPVLHETAERVGNDERYQQAAFTQDRAPVR
jgi:hypothetical protein